MVVHLVALNRSFHLEHHDFNESKSLCTRVESLKDATDFTNLVTSADK